MAEVDELLVRAELRDELSRPLRDVRDEVEDTAKAVDDLGDEAERSGRSLTKMARSGLSRMLTPLRRLSSAVRDVGRRMTDAFVRTRVGRALSGMTREVGQFGRALWRVSRGALTAATNKLRTFGRVVGRVGMRAAAVSARVLAAGLAAVAVGAGAALGYGVKLASDMEQARIGFTTMLGSAEKADAFIAEMTTFAAKTPFELPGLIDSSRQLLAMGFEAEEIMPTMQAVGDTIAAMGGGEEQLASVTRALGQMQAKGKVSAEEMLQLAEVGIPAWELLAQATGKSTAEVQDLASQGEITSDVFITAFQNMEGPLAKFGGAMEAQSQTLAGLWSTLKDTVGMKLADVSAPLVEGLRDSLPTITEQLDGFLERVGPGISEALATSLPIAVDLFTQLLEVLAPLLEQGAALAQDVMPFITVAIEAMQPFIADLARVFGELVVALAPLLPPLAELVSMVGRGLVQSIGMLMPYIDDLVVMLAEEVLPSLMPLIPAFMALIIAILPLLDPLVSLVVALLPPLVALLVPLADILVGIANVLSAILTPAFEWLGQKLEEYVVPGIQVVVGWFQTLADKISSVVGNLQDARQAVSDFTSGQSGGWAGRVTSWLNPFGDTATPRARGGGSLGSTLAAHTAIAGATGASPTITNALHSTRSGSDHHRGLALDLQGPGLQSYASTLRQLGGVAEFHGSGRDRHLHAVYAAGDTATPRATAGRGPMVAGGGGGVSLSINGPLIGQVVASDEVDVETATMRALDRWLRDRGERT